MRLKEVMGKGELMHALMEAATLRSKDGPLSWQLGDTSRHPHGGRDVEHKGTRSTEPLSQF